MTRWTLSFALLATLAPVAHAQQTVSWSDFVLPAEWSVDAWSRAGAGLEPTADVPPAVTPAPRGSLLVHTSWGAGGDFRWMALNPAATDPIPWRIRAVSLWVKGAGTKHGLNLVLKDAAGKETKCGLGDVNFTGWRQLKAQVPGGGIAGGSIGALIFDNWEQRGTASFDIGLSRLELLCDAPDKGAVAPAPTLRLMAEGPNGLLPTDGPSRGWARVTSWTAEPRHFELKGRLVDWDGKATELAPQTIEAQGVVAMAVPIEAPAFGAFHWEATLSADGQPVAKAARRIAKVVDVPKLSAEQRLGSPIAVNTHHPPIWAALARLGVHWARDYSFGFLGRGEHAPMSENGIDFAAKVKEAEAAGVTILPIAQAAFRRSDGSGFITDGNAVRAGFERLTRALPTLPAWELDNEAELGMPGQRFDAANYRQYIAAASRGIRAGSKAQVVLNGNSGILYGDTVALLKSSVRDAFDVVNNHFYTGTIPPEIAVADANTGGDERAEPMPFIDQLKRINRLAHDNGKPSWLSEIGWDVTYGPAVGEKLQAAYLARIYALCGYCGTDRTFWFYDRDVPGTGRFASSGLFDLDWGPRPAAVALAQVSREIAQAQPGGRIDLGEGTWCVLFQRADGWTAAAWTVKGEAHAPAELAAAPAFDLFGNATKSTMLTPYLTWFHLAALPAAWEGQRRAEWLSPQRLPIAPGGTARVVAQAPGANLAWEKLPDGLTATPWVEKDGRWSADLHAATTLAEGAELKLAATASGTGWSRRWPLTVAPTMPLHVASQPWEPGVTAPLTLTVSDEAGAGEVRVSVPDDQGHIYPPTLTARVDRPQALLFVPPAAVKWPVPLALTLPSGAKQTVWLRPKQLNVPASGKDGGMLAGPWLTGNAPPGKTLCSLHWSASGLQLDATLPLAAPRDGSPREFWDETNVELFLAPADKEGRSRQFWFTPFKEGADWRLYAGEWKRSEAIPATLYDDHRVTREVHVADGLVKLTVIIPTAVLGELAPGPGKTIRAFVSLQAVEANGAVARAAWPQAKSVALGDESAWGVLAFE
jgi:hypothetical protein